MNPQAKLAIVHFPALAGVVLMSLFFLSTRASAQREATRLGGELRLRLEGRQNADFNRDRLDGKIFVQQRTRLGVSHRLHPAIRLYLQLQDSRLWGEEGNSLAAIQNIDLHQGYVEIEAIANRPIALRLGRQRLRFGSGRLVGEYDWHNTGRAFDAALVRIGADSSRLALWLAQVRELNAPRISRNQEFAGAFYQNSANRIGLLESYLLLLYDGRNFSSLADLELPTEHSEAGENPLALWTFGGRLRTAEGRRLVFEAEAAYQFGRRGLRDIAAYALAASITTTARTKWKPVVQISWTFGSGDADPGDAKVKTFANLFPSAHRYLGDLDYASWSNINSVQAGFAVEPWPNARLRAGWHFFRLDTDRDNWYRAGGYNIGSPDEVYRAAVAGAGKALGNELDVALACHFRQSLRVEAGLAGFFAGEFIKKTGGLRADNSLFSYLQLDLDF